LLHQLATRAPTPASSASTAPPRVPRSRTPPRLPSPTAPNATADRPFRLGCFGWLGLIKLTVVGLCVLGAAVRQGCSDGPVHDRWEGRLAEPGSSGRGVDPSLDDEADRRRGTRPSAAQDPNALAPPDMDAVMTVAAHCGANTIRALVLRGGTVFS